MGSCLSILRKPRPQSALPTSTTHGLQGPVDSGTSPACAGQDHASETATAGDQPPEVPAPPASTDENEGMNILKDDPQTLAVSTPSMECVAHGKSKEEPAGACNQLQHISPSLGAADENEEIDVDVVQHSGLPLAAPDLSSGHSEQEHDKILGTSETLQHVPSNSTDANEEVAITAIRATKVALGLRRLPAGFYVLLHHHGSEWRTENKPSSVNNDIVEWRGMIPISSDLSAVLRFEVYASFEFQPMLGTGEQLRTLTVTVGQLLDRSARDAPFMFSPKDRDVVSPCSSLLVTVKRQAFGDSNPSGSRIVGPHWSTPEPQGELEEATDQGHGALTRYRKHGEKQDLERSIQQFERALDACPLDDPRRAAAKSNLGMVKLILSQVEGVDVLLEVALSLHWDALAARPVGHPDRLLTLIQLASAHFGRFQSGRDHVDEASGESVEGLLREAIGLSTTESYEKQAATFILQMCAGQRGGCAQSEDQSPLEQDSTSNLTTENQWNLSIWLMERFQRSGDLGDLQSAITILEGLVKSTSIWDSRYCAALGNLGSALFYRFERLGQLGDLENAISIRREAVNLSPDGHPQKPGHLNSLGTSLKARFEALGELSDLEGAISIQREAVHLSPDGHPRKSGYLTNLGISFATRFLCLGHLSDLEDAISTQREAVHLSPDGHPHKPIHLNNLGISLRTRFLRLEELRDLEDAILTHREAVHLSPESHPDKPEYLDNLGTSLQTRFEHLGELSDLEDAIATRREVVHLSPDSHHHKPAYLDNLGTSLQARFDRLGELSDLEDAISRKKGAIHLSPDGHPDKPARLDNLGVSLQTRFSRLGELNDLEDAVLTHREAVRLSPDGHPHKPRYLNNLGASLRTRFEHLGKLSDLEDAILTQREAVCRLPDNHFDKLVHLNNLGAFLQTRYERLGELSDLEGAISTLREVVQLSPDGHPHKLAHLNNLGASLKTRFDRLGDLSDLKDAISREREAIRLCPDGHPDRPGYLTNLGNSLQTRFLHLRELGDLEDAISMKREAVYLCPDGHPRKPGYLNNLGTCSRTRFEHLGELSDLEDAISRKMDAVHLSPDGHPAKPLYLNNLGNSLQNRFDRLGELSDLEDAISRKREAIRLSPDGHPDKPEFLDNLGISLQTRFERLGELSDLEDAISTQREAVRLCPDDHSDKPRYLGNLGASLQTRFERLGELSDLEDTISILRDVVHLSPDGRPDKPAYLNDLGASLQSRFDRLGEPSDLKDAILTHREALCLSPDGHRQKPRYLTNLGNSLQTRFERLGELSDLEDAISRKREAVHLCPDSHPDKPVHLDTLGISLRTRFLRLGELSDLEDAISIQREAVHLSPHNNPYKPAYLNNLALSLAARFFRLRQVTDLEHVISLSSYVASIPIGTTSVRLSAAQLWIQCARLIRHPSLLHAHSVGISLYPQLAWIGLSLSRRYGELTRSAGLVREAAAAALDAGFPQTALEWLEQGRSIVWGDLFQLRSSYDELSSAHPDHATRLHALSTQLDQASAAHEQSLSTLSAQNQSAVGHTPESLQRATDRHRALAIERDKLLQEIRRFPGFERFLLRKSFSQLCAAAHSGPVVVLNAAETRCDALIVVAGVDHVIHVPLPNFSLDRCGGLQNTMKHFVRQARDGKIAPLKGINWDHILSPLWKCVVKPVLDALAFSVAPEELSRIFWCPTGPLAFLPIHAAGFYDGQYTERGHKVFDFVVSSYVPSLATLVPSPSAVAIPSGDLRLLVVRQPASDGQAPLRGVITELAYLEDVIKRFPSAQTVLVESSVGTVEEVLELMKASDWVHFACHGVQNGVNSGLCLANRRRLTLRDIVAVARPRGGLAFLSACQTATGERDLSDEAIHIAAGMLFAGYGGVVGTMWSISDNLAPRVARDVYTDLFEKGGRPDYRDAARALQDTIGRLRNQEVRFEEWIPFIHVGL